MEAPPVIVREPSLVPVRPPLPDRAEPPARLRDPRASGTVIAPERPPPRPTDRRPVSRPMVLDVILPLIAVTIVLLVVLSWIG